MDISDGEPVAEKPMEVGILGYEVFEKVVKPAGNVIQYLRTKSTLTTIPYGLMRKTKPLSVKPPWNSIQKMRNSLMKL